MDDDAFEFRKQHGLQRLAQKFAQEAVTALTDVFLLWKDDMKSEMGMSLGARKPLGKSCRGVQAAVGTESTGGAPPCRGKGRVSAILRSQKEVKA